jgi:curli biogenesis system outer membrane secretion channel CsgG
MKIHHLFRAGLAGVALFAAAIAHAQNTPAPAAPAVQRQTIGVTDVKVLPALQAQADSAGTANALARLTQGLDSQLIAALGASRKFQVVSRSDLDVVQKEQSLGASGAVDDATAAKMFKLAGAKYVLTTTIDNFQDRTETATFTTIGQQAERRKITFSCVAKIYDATTGKLLEAPDIQFDEMDVRNNPTYIQDQGGEWADTLLANVTRLAAEKISQRVTDVLFPAKVVAKTDSQITLNRGDGTGIAVGQVWNVYAVGKELIDPDTGESLGHEEVLIGKATITDVTPRLATAELTEDRGVAVLDTARPAE